MCIVTIFKLGLMCIDTIFKNVDFLVARGERLTNRIEVADLRGKRAVKFGDAEFTLSRSLL